MTGSRERSTALVRRPTSDVARTWEVSLRPEEVRKLVRSGERMTKRAVADEHALERAPHDGSVFVDAKGDSIVLWRRPGRSWLYAVRGFSERVPYPDMLRLDVEPTPHGSRVVATWEKHPHTKRSALWIAAIALVGFVLVVMQTSAAPISYFLLIAALCIPAARFYAHRSARKELLVAAHAALAAHERGAVDDEDSAYRADRRLAIDRPKRRTGE